MDSNKLSSEITISEDRKQFKAILLTMLDKSLDNIMKNPFPMYTLLECIQDPERKDRLISSFAVAIHTVLLDAQAGIQYKYIWQLHNSINSRLNKPIVNWDDMYQLYLKGELFSKDKDVQEKSTD